MENQTMLLKYEWALLVGLVIFSSISTFGGLVRVQELAGGPAIAPENLRALAHPLPIVLHILASFVFCIAGALQFLSSVRRNHPKTHRRVGWCVATSGIVSAATGLWMTIYFVFPEELQGPLLYWNRVVLSPLMILLIIHAIISIRARKITQHAAAILRAYAIGQGASTQAFFGIAWIIATGVEPVGLLRDWLMIFAWGFNLLIVEALIRKYLRRVPQVPQTASR